MVPAYKVFDDIKRRYGSQPLFPSGLGIGPSEAPYEWTNRSQQTAALIPCRPRDSAFNLHDHVADAPLSMAFPALREGSRHYNTSTKVRKARLPTFFQIKAYV